MNISSQLYPVNNPIRQSMLLDGLWRFQFDPSSQGLAENWQQGLPSSISMPVPSSFSDLFTEGWQRDYAGDFWYETEFFLQKPDASERYIIRFGSVTHRCKVFCNGIPVGEHEGGFLPVVIDVTEAVNAGRNLLSVLVNNELNSTCIPCGKSFSLHGTKRTIGSFDFFNYSGIHRSVWFLKVPAVSIQDYTLSYELKDSDALVSYEVETEGSANVFVTLTDACGKVAATSSGSSGILTVTDAHLWQVRNAYLYTITIRLEKDGILIDQYDAKIGIRTVKVEGEQILINGAPVYLKGFGKHEDFEVLGRGFNPAVMKRDYECMKWINANCFRTSHYPYAEEWYQMADEEGFLIIDEVPAVGMLDFFNPATAGNGTSLTGFFASCADISKLSENHSNAIREMIKRDKNHPSVFAWSVFNEAETITGSARDYFGPLFSLAKELDLQKRPVTGVLEKTSSPQDCKVYPMMDFICLNRYYGWYISGGDMIDAEKQFLEEMDAWAEKKLNVPFLFTEFGTDTLETLHKLPAVMWTQEYQCEYMEMYFKVFDRYSFVQGELTWNFADFQTGQGLTRVNGNKKGIFTRNRQPKDVAFTMKKRWETI